MASRMPEGVAKSQDRSQPTLICSELEEILDNAE